jgi:hypothetical protein
VGRALNLLEVLPNPSDAQVQQVARRVAERSMDLMAAAESSAAVYKVAELAPSSFAAGTEAKTLAQRSFTREDYRQAGRQAVAATAAFRRAAEEARTAAELARKAEDARRTEEARKAEDARRAAEEARRAEDARKAAEEARRAEDARKANEAAPARLSVADSQGIADALSRFKDAYVSRDVDRIRRLIRNLPDQQMKIWRNNFDNICRSVNVTFSGMEIFVGNDLASATANVRSTYYCRPKINAPELEMVQDDVFTLRKVAGNWVIERMGALN